MLPADRLGGRVHVVARCERWSATRPQSEALRAQLRGLGARLVIISPQLALLLGPDDPPAPIVGAEEEVRGFAVTVLDADGALRFSHAQAALEADAADTLIAALEAAVEERRNHAPLPSRREVSLS